jgi:hypothetical protein
MKAFWIGQLIPDLNKLLKYYLDIFEIKDKIGNWYLLQNQFGKNGWANEKDLGKI